MRFSLPKLSVSSFVILCALGISVFLHTYKINALPLNEDEAAQGYNTYSVLQTGYDEYGRIPLRYLSFGESKLPLTGMLSAPFITFLGLTDLSVRIPVILLGIVFPLLFYGASYALTKSKKVASVACVLASTNTWLYTMSRHQHEAVVLTAITLLIISVVYQYLGGSPNKERSDKRTQTFIKILIKIALLLFMGLYTYHSGKIIMPFLGIVSMVFVWRYHKKQFPIAVAIIFSAFLIFSITELAQPNNRVGSLSYFTAPVFTHEIEEGRRLGGSPLYYNKIVYGAHRALERTLGYISPHFLLIASDPNPRYGSPSVHLLTIFEYIFFIVGLILMWLKRHPARFFLTTLLMVTIFPAAAALPIDSATRSLVMTVPLTIIASIGITYVWGLRRPKRQYVNQLVIALLAIGVIVHLIGFAASANTYFTEYLESETTQRAWQSGMKEVADYVWKNYDKFDKFYVTREFGQPYIFLLFYKPYPPKMYQAISKPGKYNEYGFWEQDGFDKFVFQKPIVYTNEERTAYIMTPAEVRLSKLKSNDLKPIVHEGKVKFYVKENL